MSLTDELLALERDGWEALTTAEGADYYRQHLARGALMAFPFGVLDREAAIEAMAAAPPWERFEISDPQAVAVGDDAGVLVYRVVAHRAGEEPYHAVIASTFVRGDGGWRLAFHQQSP